MKSCYFVEQKIKKIREDFDPITILLLEKYYCIYMKIYFEKILQNSRRFQLIELIEYIRSEISSLDCKINSSTIKLELEATTESTSENSLVNLIEKIKEQDKTEPGKSLRYKSKFLEEVYKIYTSQ